MRYGRFQGLSGRNDLGTMIVFVEVSLGDERICFLMELYGLSQQEILKNRLVKPLKLESQMMTVQRGSSIPVEDM